VEYKFALSTVNSVMRMSEIYITTLNSVHSIILRHSASWINIGFSKNEQRMRPWEQAVSQR